MKNMLRKGLTFSFIILFIGVCVTSSTIIIDMKQSSNSESNNPPYIPSNPYPIGSIDDPNVTLSWDGGDPDPNDNVIYDIYFGISNPLYLIDTVGPYPANKTRIYYYLGILENY